MDTEKIKSDLTSFFNEYEFLRKEKDELNQTKLNRRHEIMNNLFIEWDEELKDNNIMLILCGSLINMMESQTLSYNSPLYGRRTGSGRC